ncbi:MAG: glyoxalase [Verrucomicrobia bacterium]|nr:glyoxalase [Verrucomicrobiota bacterium]
MKPQRTRTNATNVAPMITALDHVHLSMPRGNEAKARSYFGGVLGMEEQPKPDPLALRGGCWFRSGSVIVHVGVEEEFIPPQKAHSAFCVADLDLVATRLQESGAVVTWDQTLPNRRRFHTTDPFGNRLEFLRDGDGFSQK